MENMDQIQSLASASEKRIALPLGADSEIDLSVRNCLLLGDLNEVPQTRILNALKSRTEEVDSLVHNAKVSEKILSNCT